MPLADRTEAKVESSSQNAAAAKLSDNVYSEMMQKSPGSVAADIRKTEQGNTCTASNLRGILPPHDLSPHGSGGHGDTQAGGAYQTGHRPGDSGKISPTHAVPPSDKPLK
jgi:hypothetical protein